MTAGSIASALKLLLQGYTPASRTVSYSFSATQPTYDNNIGISGYSLMPGGSQAVYYLTSSAYQSAGGSQFISAMASTKTALSTISGVALNLVTSGIGDINITGLTQRLYKGSLEAGGFTIPPNYGSSGQSYTPARSDIFLLPASYDGTFTASRTLSHETQHALGLLDANGILTGPEDSFQYTIMSYNPYAATAYAQPVSPQLYDIAAIQALYGRNDNTNSGDTTYNSFSTANGQDDLKTIWDGGNSTAGGTDTIDASQANTPSYVDLRPGHFSSLGPQSTVNVAGGPTPSIFNLGKQNVAIAFGTYIENAKGSSSNDLLVGNRLTNRIEGGLGDDIIYGDGSAYDKTAADYHLIDTSASHLANPTGTIGTQTTNEKAQTDVLLGQGGSDYIYGSNGSDQIYGGLGDDTLLSDLGADLFYGGDMASSVTNLSADGTDTVDYSNLTKIDPTKGIKVVVSATSASSRYSSNADYAHASWVTDLGRDKDTDTLISVENVIGTSADDILAVSSLDPTRLASNHLGGLDTVALGGQTNGDLVDLSKMASGIKVDLSLAKPFLSTVADTSHGIYVTGAEQILGSNYNDIITGSSGNDVLAGGYGADTITGGAGNDYIFGGNGGGTFDAGAGNDKIVAQGGIVTMGAGTDTLYKQKTSNGGLGGMILTDHNPVDRIYWNGYLQTGTTSSFGWIDQENDSGVLGWTDQHGTQYYTAHDASQNGEGLMIEFPNNADDDTSGNNDYIFIQNFQNGDYGINIPDWDIYADKTDFTNEELDALPLSNICLDGLVNDWSNLTGWQTSISTSGGAVAPTPPTSAGPGSVPSSDKMVSVVSNTSKVAVAVCSMGMPTENSFISNPDAGFHGNDRFENIALDHHSLPGRSNIYF